jgi:cytochrome b561
VKKSVFGSSWSATAKFLHWLVAVLIFLQFALGYLAKGWSLSPTKLDLFVWHKSTGIVILTLVLLRLLLRLGASAPALPEDTPAWERAAARSSQLLLYVFMISLPLSGWIINSAAGIPFKIFWWLELPPLGQADKQVATLTAYVHFWLGVVFAALVVVHISAALRHHFVKRDSVLRRMLPMGSMRNE